MKGGRDNGMDKGCERERNGAREMDIKRGRDQAEESREQKVSRWRARGEQGETSKYREI